jgi:hypothetical protein
MGQRNGPYLETNPFQSLPPASSERPLPLQPAQLSVAQNIQEALKFVASTAGPFEIRRQCRNDGETV